MKNTSDVAVDTPTPAFYAALQRAYEHFNARLFDGALPHCLLTVQRERGTWGFFSAARWAHNPSGRTLHEIALNPACFTHRSMLELFQTLVHEMVHLWQHEYGRPGRGHYHNAEWADKMESIGLMPSDTGRPGGRRTGQRMHDYPLRGGRFEAAARELMEAGFQLPWLDRFPAPCAAERSPSSTVAAAIPAEDHAVSETPDEAAAREPPAPDTAETTSDAADGGVAEDMVWKRLLLPLASSVPAIIETPPARPGARKPGKTTYCCACGHKVWGKAGLDLYCGDCNGPFTATA